jgi:hypothetical protein
MSEANHFLSVLGLADSIIFLLLSMVFIATTLYLPQHIAFLINRAYFYVHGEGLDGGVLEAAKEAAAQTLTRGVGSVAREL